MASVGCIYVLKDPRDNTIRYVGQSFSVENRYDNHCSTSEKSAKANWIKELKQSGFKPVLEIVETIDEYSNLDSRERYWIKHYIETGCQLTNMLFDQVYRRSINDMMREIHSLLKDDPRFQHRGKINTLAIEEYITQKALEIIRHEMSEKSTNA